MARDTLLLFCLWQAWVLCFCQLLLLAISSTDLAAYNQSLTLAVMISCQKPLKIAGYQYIGYLKKKQHQLAQRGNSQLPAPSKKEASAISLISELKELGRPTTEARKEAQPAGGRLSLREGKGRKLLLVRQFARCQTPVHERPELQFIVKQRPRPKKSPIKMEYQYSDDLAEGQSRVIRAGTQGFARS